LISRHDDIPCHLPALAPPRPFVTVVTETVALTYQVPLSDLHSPSRGSARIALARQVAMYLAHVVGGLQLTHVGEAFGRDRTTVAHACAVIESRRDDPNFNRTLDLLEGIIARVRELSSRLSRSHHGVL
jgi:chromosomal replication initiation ATPase DnaA